MKHITILFLLFMLNANAMAQKVIDVHSNIVTNDYVQMLHQHGAELEDGDIFLSFLTFLFI